MNKIVEFLKKIVGKGPKIKGNITITGEKIYHVPDGKLYNAVKAEEMFYTEEDAQKAGFRKSRR